MSESQGMWQTSPDDAAAIVASRRRLGVRFSVFGERESGLELRDSYTKWVSFDATPRAGEQFFPGQFGPQVHGLVTVDHVEHAPFPTDSAEPTAYVVINYRVPEMDTLHEARRDWFVLNEWHVLLNAQL